MRKILIIIATLAISPSVFGQSDEELLAQVRKHYYELQNNLDSYDPIVVSDTVFCRVKEGKIAKVSFVHDSLREEYFYYPDSDWPYFVFTSLNGKENRFYMDSDYRTLRMFKWLDHEKREVEQTHKDYTNKMWHYLIRGKNLKTTTKNQKIDQREIIEVKRLLDSLSTLVTTYDTVVFQPFAADDPERSIEEDGGFSVGDESYSRYLSTDETIELEKSAS